MTECPSCGALALLLLYSDAPDDPTHRCTECGEVFDLSEDPDDEQEEQ